MNSDWTQQTWSFRRLRRTAFSAPREAKAIDWLRSIGVIPEGVKWRKESDYITLSLDDEITGQYLAEAAYEFDKQGGGTPVEFMTWLAFEVSGTSENRSLKLALETVGRDDD